MQGYCTRDSGFRTFRNEKLERYQTLFDLAARYALMAANAYDYETGLLNTTRGREFVSRISLPRALGVVANGAPVYAGSNTGDPGLSSVLAEMKADWDVLEGRLGFNNPDEVRHDGFPYGRNSSEFCPIKETLAGGTCLKTDALTIY